jgi:hypothetical protein
MKRIKMVGRKFGKLLVLEEVEKRNNKRAFLCRCDCEKEYVVMGDNLRSGNSTQCMSCSSKIKGGNHRTHGMTGTKVFKAWMGMRERCRNPNHKQYKSYGGRGITICDQWYNNFESFLADVGEPPTERHQIDRRDNGKGYEPGNCRWVTGKTQQNNKRNNVIIEYGGKKLTIAEWSEELGIKASTLYMRVQAGWSSEDVVCRPLKSKMVNPVLEIKGIFGRLSQWADIVGKHPNVIRARLNMGWSPIKAVFDPNERGKS